MTSKLWLRDTGLLIFFRSSLEENLTSDPPLSRPSEASDWLPQI